VTIRLYDTARNEVVPFEPGQLVRTYICGITPYDSTHLGHAFCYLSHDLLIRRLEDLGHTVQMVRNVTDVDDSILPKARELGIDFLELARVEMERFHCDLTSLDARPAFSEPRATESIAEIVALIEQLEAGGHTYTADGTTWFDVSTYPDFGLLSGYDEAAMVELAAERGGTPDDPRQRNQLDFILWMPSASDEPVWDSPFGPGRPGWHIECSAMAGAAFGGPLDLHAGGHDLVFPHHECEIAQTVSARGEPLAHHWMHNGLVAYEGTKMSKSLGNLVFVRDLVAAGDARAVRLALLAHNYRHAFEWFDEEFETSMKMLDGLITAAAPSSEPSAGEMTNRVRDALDDDLDTPSIYAEFARLAVGQALGEDDAADLLAAAALVGIDLRGPLSNGS
jgi:L-cysteine:1D-myo-inositol 2-amino-2-deoxy-alpha-D-glucopyranoside ligase